MINNFIAITIGDIKGIGIEILLKLWKKNKINNYNVLKRWKRQQDNLQKKKLMLREEGLLTPRWRELLGGGEE